MQTHRERIPPLQTIHSLAPFCAGSSIRSICHIRTTVGAHCYY
jgi:hypothetical protein